MSVPLGPRARIVYQGLRDGIDGGALAPGARLPSHDQLAREYGVALLTVRQAIDRLEEDGLLSAEQGRGTFVRPAPAMAEAGRATIAALVSASPLATYALDTESRVWVWNAACEALFGWCEAEVLGQPPPHLPPEHRDSAQQYFERAMAGESFLGLEGRALTAGGETTIRASLAPLYDRYRHLIGTMVVAEDISARLAGEEALRASEERYRGLVEASPDGIYLIALDGTILMRNTRAEEMFGRRERGSVDNFEPIVAGDRARVLAGLERMVETGIPVMHQEVAVTLPDGSLMHVEGSAAPIRDAHGQTVAYISVVRDISARRRAEAALEESRDALRLSEERFRAIFERSPVGVVLRDTDGKFAVVNRAYADLVGYSQEELASVSFIALTHPEDLTRQNQLEAELLNGTRDDYQLEKRYIHRAGHTVWVNMNVSLVRDAAGTPQYLLGVVEDVTSRRAMIDALRESEEQHTRILETIADGILQSDLAGTHLFANAAAERILGVPRDEIVGRPEGDRQWTVISVDGQADTLEARPTARTVRTQTPVHDVEMVLERRDGTQVTISANSEVMYEAGDPTGVVVSFTDVTERKQAEEALRASEEQYRSVVEASLDGISVASLRGTITFANTQLARLLGYGSADELIGRNNLDLVVPADRSIAATQAREAVARGQFSNLVLDLQRADGTTFPGEINISLVRNNRGEPTGLTCVVRDITDRRRYEEQLRYQALHDALTGLPNRTLFLDRLDQALQMAVRTNRNLAVLLIDLDRFKEVNDTLGHHYGDLILNQVAGYFREILRSSDTVARLGGDEFGIVLPGSDRSGAEAVAAKVLSLLAQPVTLDGRQFYLGASIGIVIYPTDGADHSLLLRRADVAMYAAKRSASGFSFYDADIDPHSMERLELIAGLRQAIDSEGLDVVFQPKRELPSGRILGMEALTRWDHPDFGPIPPSRFIPLAETTGLIRPLTLWVLNAAVQQARAWQDAGLFLPVAVNLSAWSLHDKDLMEIVQRALQRHGVDPARLQIEVTESALMLDPARAHDILRALRTAGIGVSLDDFGTGYSSLAYLKHLPVDEIKIDRSFVRGMEEDAGDATIVRSVIDLGHNLGLQVVAEGVESAEVVQRLTALGCDAAQGRVVCAPLPPSELAAFLQLAFPL